MLCDFIGFHLKQKNEFQWYTGDDDVSFCQNNKLHIKPSFAQDKLGVDALYESQIHLENCTDESTKSNCYANASHLDILDPIRSAHLHTKGHFAFRYGHVQILAQVPLGDFLHTSKKIFERASQLIL